MSLPFQLRHTKDHRQIKSTTATPCLLLPCRISRYVEEFDAAEHFGAVLIVAYHIHESNKAGT
jgi:hypothetical protein